MSSNNSLCHLLRTLRGCVKTSLSACKEHETIEPIVIVSSDGKTRYATCKMQSGERIVELFFRGGKWEADSWQRLLIERKTFKLKTQTFANTQWHANRSGELN